MLFDDAELLLSATDVLLPIQLLDIALAVPGFSHQSSVARIDNVVLTVVPEPSSLVPLVMIAVFNASSRRRGTCRTA